MYYSYCFNLGQYRECVKVVEKALKIDPKDSDAWYMKGQ